MIVRSPIIHAHSLGILGVLVLVGCTNNVDLGNRSNSGTTGSGPGNSAATAASLCEKFPDHRLNWTKDPSTGDFQPVMAPPGTCAEKTKCLDSARLDSAVTAKALACLELDIDKNKEQACKVRDVANVSVTRAAVTTFQNSWAKKRSECGESVTSDMDLCAVLADATLEEATRCLDKPCAVYDDCLRNYEPERDCIEDLFTRVH
jgi:hypothetical protein